jgi:hypothetical protein
VCTRTASLADLTPEAVDATDRRTPMMDRPRIHSAHEFAASPMIQIIDLGSVGPGLTIAPIGVTPVCPSMTFVPWMLAPPPA